MRSNVYTDAVVDAILPDSMMKLTLLMLAYHADANGVCWPGKPKLAKLCCVEESTIHRAVKRLLELELMTITGDHPTFPGSCKITKEYTLDLKKIVSLGSGELPIAESHPSNGGMGSSPMGSGEVWVAKSLPKIQNSEDPAIGGFAVGVEPAAVVETGTVPYRTESATTTQNKTNGKSKPLGALPRTPPGASRRPDPSVGISASRPPVPPPPVAERGPLSDEDIADLWELWGLLAPVPDPNGASALRSFEPNVPAARLGVIMWWAFTLSNWWSKPENWKTGCDMSTFLVVSGKMDQQFGDWRNGVRDKFLKMFPTVRDVINHVNPPEVPKDGGGKGFEIDEDVASELKKYLEEADEVPAVVAPPTPAPKPPAPKPVMDKPALLESLGHKIKWSCETDGSCQVCDWSVSAITYQDRNYTCATTQKLEAKRKQEGRDRVNKIRAQKGLPRLS